MDVVPFSQKSQIPAGSPKNSSWICLRTSPPSGVGSALSSAQLSQAFPKQGLKSVLNRAAHPASKLQLKKMEKEEFPHSLHSVSLFILDLSGNSEMGTPGTTWNSQIPRRGFSTLESGRIQGDPSPPTDIPMAFPAFPENLWLQHPWKSSRPAWRNLG